MLTAGGYLHASARAVRMWGRYKVAIEQRMLREWAEMLQKDRIDDSMCTQYNKGVQHRHQYCTRISMEVRGGEPYRPNAAEHIQRVANNHSEFVWLR